MEVGIELAGALHSLQSEQPRLGFFYELDIQVRFYLNIDFRNLRMSDNYCFRQWVAIEGFLLGNICSGCMARGE